MPSSKQLIGIILTLTIGGFLFAYLLPPAITALSTTNTTGWDSGVVALWAIMPLMLVVAGMVAVIAVILSVMD